MQQTHKTPTVAINANCFVFWQSIGFATNNTGLGRLKDQGVQYNNLSATIKLGMQISMAAMELLIFSVVGIKMPFIKRLRSKGRPSRIRYSDLIKILKCVPPTTEHWSVSAQLNYGQTLAIKMIKTTKYKRG